MEVSGQLYAPVALPPGKNPGTIRIGDWMVLRTRTGCFGEEKLSGVCWDSNPRIFHLVARYRNETRFTNLNL